MANVLEVLNLPTNTLLNLHDSNQGSVQVIVQPSGGAGGGLPLSNVLFVDQGSVSIDTPDGSIARPFPTLTAAANALTLIGPGVLVVTPYDYAATEPGVNLAHDTTIVGWSGANRNAPAGQLPLLPTLSTGLDPITVNLQNVQVSGVSDANASATILLDGCEVFAWNLGNHGTIAFVDCVFSSGIALTDYGGVSFDVPSYLSWLDNGGSIGGVTPTPVVSGVPAFRLPFNLPSPVTTLGFFRAYGLATGGVEGAGQIPNPAPTKIARLRLRCTGVTTSANLTAIVRVNGVDTALTATLAVGQSAVESMLQLAISDNALVSVRNSTTGIAFTGLVWAEVDLYP